eukprot:Opistho-1_new@10722
MPSRMFLRAALQEGSASCRTGVSRNATWKTSLKRWKPKTASPFPSKTYGAITGRSCAKSPKRMTGTLPKYTSAWPCVWKQSVEPPDEARHVLKCRLVKWLVAARAVTILPPRLDRDAERAVQSRRLDVECCAASQRRNNATTVVADILAHLPGE